VYSGEQNFQNCQNSAARELTMLHQP